MTITSPSVGTGGTTSRGRMAALTRARVPEDRTEGDAPRPGRHRLIVLSAGHSSSTLYLQLYFAGYGMEPEGHLRSGRGAQDGPFDHRI
ncbi:hypothetical protein [Pseudonocardia spinosispora]|uniref:hypothetical protein n=1 Tax=Pseudonocardia spinosispora TaxID=103441 RepID=UPI000405B616